jgi:hypothetical protein
VEAHAKCVEGVVEQERRRDGGGMESRTQAGWGRARYKSRGRNLGGVGMPGQLRKKRKEERSREAASIRGNMG